MLHNWTFLSENETTATYKCIACAEVINFCKEGYGEPVAHPPAIPEHINEYTSLECSAPYRIVSKRNFLDRFTTVELASILTLAESNQGVKVLLYKFEQTAEVPLDHPETLLSLQYLASLGVLDPQRIPVMLS